jgi:hypothetical protein
MTFTKELTAQLRVAHERAVEEGWESFAFNGEHFYTNYAKYLLEYLDSVGLSV